MQLSCRFNGPIIIVIAFYVVRDRNKNFPNTVLTTKFHKNPLSLEITVNIPL